MSEPDPAPATQKPGGPAAPPPPAGQPPERSKWWHDWLRLLAEPHKIPGRTGAVILAFFLYAQWQGAFDPLTAAAEAVGGPLAATVTRMFASPLAAMLLALCVGFALWATSAWQDKESRRFVMAFTWVMLAAFVVPLSSVALFGYFVAESKIPTAVRYYEWQATERRLSDAQRDGLYVALRKVAGQLPAFNVAASRDPESAQLAHDFMAVFFSAGLRMENGARQDAKPELIDVASPSVFRGVMIGVRDRHSPPSGALVLRDALKEGGAPVRFIDAWVSSGERFMFLVGPK